MFLVKAGSFKEVWRNKQKDDFIRFLPKAIGCQPQDLQIWKLTEDARAAVRLYENSVDHRLLLGDGEIVVMVGGQEVDRFVLVPMERSWPYEDDGKGGLKWLGNN